MQVEGHLFTPFYSYSYTYSYSYSYWQVARMGAAFLGSGATGGTVPRHRQKQQLLDRLGGQANPEKPKAD